jgi:hypothetical protein
MRDDHAAACHEDGSTSIFTGCLMCRVDFVLVVPTVSYLRWLDGESAQSSFPMMPKGERELLVSGTCDECFKRCLRWILKKKNGTTLIMQTMGPNDSQCRSCPDDVTKSPEIESSMPRRTVKAR